MNKLLELRERLQDTSAAVLFAFSVTPYYPIQKALKGVV